MYGWPQEVVNEDYLPSIAAAQGCDYIRTVDGFISKAVYVKNLSDVVRREATCKRTRDLYHNWIPSPPSDLCLVLRDGKTKDPI